MEKTSASRRLARPHRRRYRQLCVRQYRLEKSRMLSKGRFEPNMLILADTIKDVVRAMNPMMILFCEVGEVTIPLTQAQMEQVADEVKRAWQDTAIEHINLICFLNREVHISASI